MEPLVICEKLATLFKFWSDGKVHTGMNYRNELFQPLRSAKSQGRQQIYDAGWALSEEGVQVVITVSDSQYTLWASLRSLSSTEDAVSANSLEPSDELANLGSMNLVFANS